MVQLYVEPESVKKPCKEFIPLNWNTKDGNNLFILKELYSKNMMPINDLLGREE